MTKSFLHALIYFLLNRNLISLVLKSTKSLFFFNIVHDVRLQKISIPTPGKVNGNSKQEGVSKAKIFVGKYEAKPEFSGGGGSN